MSLTRLLPRLAIISARVVPDGPCCARAASPLHLRRYREATGACGRLASKLHAQWASSHGAELEHGGANSVWAVVAAVVMACPRTPRYALLRGLGWSRGRQGKDRRLLDGDGRRSSYLTNVGGSSFGGGQAEGNFQILGDGMDGKRR
jgi:hypothetical protein